ncbi:hypothetical protein ACOMCU_00980 [Lysinibacillus sp. UGB7]|uniref:hypothetical protein n=1 Tax=Lysinibacillus sp. UGB7 TaxID=3411039 RepID=UPI003B7E1266
MDDGKFNGHIYYYDGDVNDDGNLLWEKLENKVVKNKIIAEHNKLEALPATA